MSKVKRNCEFCNVQFETEQKYINRGNGKFCSKSCSTKHQMTNQHSQIGLSINCSWCDKEFYISPSRKSRSKSKLLFCCREHKDLAQRLTGLEELTPSHYNTTSTRYRDIAFRKLQQKCSRCGYDKIPKILQVHHKDKNHENNKLENLEFLCPNCHAEIHYC